jgi:hypothetical protein
MGLIDILSVLFITEENLGPSGGSENLYKIPKA